MVAHGKLTSSHQITEVNSCVDVLGKTSRTILHLSTSSDGVPGGTKTGQIVKGISRRKCTEFSPEEMKPYKRELQPLHLHLHLLHIWMWKSHHIW